MGLKTRRARWRPLSFRSRTNFKLFQRSLHGFWQKTTERVSYVVLGFHVTSSSRFKGNTDTRLGCHDLANLHILILKIKKLFLLDRLKLLG